MKRFIGLCGGVMLAVLAVGYQADGSTNTTTVVFQLRQWSGGSLNRALMLAPVHNPLTDGSNAFWGPTLRFQPTNGVVTAALIPNDYDASLEGLGGTIRISVPSTNRVMYFPELTTNLTAYSYGSMHQTQWPWSAITNPPAVLTNLLAVEGGGLSVTGTIWAQAFIGDGRGLMGINSNGLDAATAAQLAKAGNSNPSSLTNLTTFWQRLYANSTASANILITNRRVFTFAGDPLPVPWLNTNSVFLAFLNCGQYDPSQGGTSSGAAQSHILWQCPTNNSWFDMFFNPYHDSSSHPGQSEMQISTGGGIAVSCGYGLAPGASSYPTTRRALQLGIGGHGQPFIYHQFSLVFHSWETNLSDCMYPTFYKALVYTNVNQSCYAGSRTVDGGDAILPAMTFRAYSSDGSGAWTWYDNLSETVDIYGQWANMQTATKRFEVIAGPQGGVNINGAIKINGVFGITTNYTLSTGDVMSISNGIIVKIAPPTPYAWEPETTNYLARIAVPLSSGAAATNIDVFVKALKTAGVWTNLDALYPFCGGNATSNALNAISTNYTINWSGAFGTNNASGVDNNGATACYGDTGWTNGNVNTGTYFVYMKTQGNIPATPGYAGVFGARDANNIAAKFYMNDNNFSHDGVNCGKYLTGVVVTNAMPNSYCLVRTNATEFVSYTSGLGSGSVNIQSSVAAVALSVWVFDVNSVGASFGAWRGKAQGFAFSGRGLTGAQYAALHSAFVALNANLGR